MDSRFFIYRFLDRADNVLYVGETTDLYKRIVGHETNGHLKITQYELVDSIEYIEVESEADLHVAELFFINKYKPPFNKKGKKDGCLSVMTWEGGLWKEYTESYFKELHDRIRKFKREQSNLKQKTVALPENLIKKIQKHQKDNYFSSFTESAIQIIVKGLESANLEKEGDPVETI